MNWKKQYRRLEQRILLDAAGAATVAETEADNVPEAVREAAREALQQEQDDLTSLIAALGESRDNADTGPEPADERRHILFIDSQSPQADDIERLLDTLSDAVEVHHIEPNQDGFAFIADTLADSEKTYDALHIVSDDGEAGELRLGNTILTRASLAGKTLLHIQSWGESITEEGDIHVYGARVAEGDAGKSLVKAIAMLTGAEVDASIDEEALADALAMRAAASTDGSAPGTGLNPATGGTALVDADATNPGTTPAANTAVSDTLTATGLAPIDSANLEIRAGVMLTEAVGPMPMPTDATADARLDGAPIVPTTGTALDDDGTAPATGTGPADPTELIAALPADLEATALVVVDTAVTGYEDLLAGLAPGTEYLLIDAAENGLQKLADYVAGRDDITSIHILSHGDQGEFSLGTVTLNSDNIDQYADLLAQIGASLTEQGDLLLYGCRVAAEGEGDANEPSGAEFVARIAEITGADVAASTDDTGAAGQGGDWDLEYSIGQMDGANLELTGFTGLLAPPAAVNDSINANPNDIVTVAAPGLLANDSDPDGDTFTITEVGGTAGARAAANVGEPIRGQIGGEFIINADGSYTFNPNGDFDYLAAGSATSTAAYYQITDSNGETATARLLVSVVGTADPNRRPTPVDDTGATDPSTTLTVSAANGVLANDTDPDTGDTLVVTRVGGVANNLGNFVGQAIFTSERLGTVNIAADGSYTFNPRNDFASLAAGTSRTVSVVYEIADNHGAKSSTVGTLRITVTAASTTPPNQAPTVTDDTGATDADTPITIADGTTGTSNADLLNNDSDPNTGDTLTITEVGASAATRATGNVGKAIDGSNGGEFTVSANGAWSFDPDDDFDDLAASAERTTTVTYRVSDGTASATALLTVTVTGTAAAVVNNAPVAADDTGATDPDTKITVADGDTGTNADVLNNDTDADGNTLTVTALGTTTSDLQAGFVSNTLFPPVFNGVGGGEFTFRPNGAWTFDPDGDFDDLAAGASKTASVVYQISDGNGGTDTATLRVTVTAAAAANRAPTVVADTGATNADDTITVADGTTGTTNADLLNNDSDEDGNTLTINQVGSSASAVAVANLGKATDGSNGGEFTISANGAWSFDPDGDFDDLNAGVDKTTTIYYLVSDGTATTASELTVTVTGTNRQPVPTSDTGAVNADATLSVNAANGVLANDSDPDGDTLNVIRVGTSAGSLVNVGSTTTGSAGGTFTVSADGSYTFDPGTSFDDLAPGATRNTQVFYLLSDGHRSALTSLRVTVTGVAATTPVAVDDTGATDPDTRIDFATAVGLLANDSDPNDDTLTVTGIGPSLQAGFVGKGSSIGPAFNVASGGWFAVAADGTWAFDPAGDFNDLKAGASKDTTLVYQISDGTETATATITVTVTAAEANVSPVAKADTGTTDEDTVLTVAAGDTGTSAGLLVNDTDANAADTLTISAVGLTANTASADNVGKAFDGSNGGSFTIAADGSYTFDPDGDFERFVPGGKDTTAVDYVISDGKGGTASATLIVTVTGVNDLPVTGDDFGRVTEGEFLRVLNGANGTSRSITVGGVTTTNIEDADLLINDFDEDGTISISQVQGFTETGGPENVNLAAAKAGDVASATTHTRNGGSITIRADGSYTFLADNADFGDLDEGEIRETDVIYITRDSSGGETPAMLTIRVVGTNEIPETNDDLGTATADKVTTVADGATGTTRAVTDDSGTTTMITENADILLNDSDPNDDALAVTEAGPAHGATRTAANVGKAFDATNGGRFTIGADGSWSFDPDDDFDALAAGDTKTTEAFYRVADVHGGDALAKLTVTVTGVNDAPTAVDDLGAAEEGTTLTVADGDTGTVVTNTDGSTSTVNADLLDNDTDPDTGASLTISEVGIGADPLSADNLGTSTAGDNGGHFNIKADGSWTFIPGAAFGDLEDGETRETSINYRVTDGTATDIGTVTVTVTGINALPVATSDQGWLDSDQTLSIAADAAETDFEGNTVSGGLLANDSDPEGDDIRILEALNNPADGSAATYVAVPDGGMVTVRGHAGGTFTIHSDGQWAFDPGADFDGIKDTDSVVTQTAYRLTDVADGSRTGNSAFLVVNVFRPNDAPVAVDDLGTIDEDTLHIVSDGSTGTEITNADSSTMTVNADLLLNDTDADSDALAITGVNGYLLVVDDDGGPNTYTARTEAVDPGTIVYGSKGGQFTVNADGSWVFNPASVDNAFDDLAPGESRTTSVTYTVSDGRYAAPTAATLTVTVTGANDPPSTSDDFGATTENATITVADGATGTDVTDGSGTTRTANADILLNDSDPEGDPLVVSRIYNYDTTLFEAVPAGGSLTRDGGTGGSFTIHSNGAWSFDPGTDFDDLKAGATRQTSMTYYAADDSGAEAPGGRFLTVTVTGEDDVPVLTPVTAGVTEDVGVDGDGNLVASGTFTTTGGDAGEDMFMPGVFGSVGSLTLAVDGTWTWKIPNSRMDVQELPMGETLTETIIVTSSDTVTTTSITITVTGADDTPTLVASTGSVTEDLDADLDDDGNLVATGSATTGGDRDDLKLTAETLTGTYGGTLETVAADGTWSYKLDNTLAAIQGLKPTDSLTDTFTVTGADGTSTTTVTITINGADDVPTLALSAGTVTEDADVDDSGNLVATGTVPISGGDTGEDKVTAETLTGSYGNLKVSSDGSWTYTADNSQKDIQQLPDSATLSESFVVTSSDTVTTGSVRIRINGADDAQTVTGTMTATLTEGKNVDGAGHLQTPSFTLTFSGGDLNEPLGFERSYAPTNAPFGAVLNLSGLTTPANTATWNFFVANSDPTVQRINPGENLVLVYSVQLADSMTRIPFTITIVGAESQLSLSPATGAVTEDVAVDDDGNLVATGTIPALDDAKDLATLRYTAETKTGTYGDLTIDEMGAWTYKADNSQRGIQELHQPDVVQPLPGSITPMRPFERTEEFTVTTADGMTTTTVTITITGADDTQTVATEQLVTVTEDVNVEAGSNDLVVESPITISGGDSGEDGFQGVGGNDIVGRVGVTQLGDGSFIWVYRLDNTLSAVQDLRPGEILSATGWTLSGSDGGRVFVNARVIGADDVPVKGVGEATLTEDSDIDADGTIDAELVASGTVTISGGDANEDSYVLVTAGSAESTLDADTAIGTATGTSGGVLTWQADGTWSYTIDNTLAAVQGLSPSDTLTETFTFHANDAITAADIAAGSFVDGTTASDATTTTVTITIMGTDDVPALTGDTGGLTEDIAVSGGNLIASGTVRATGGDEGESLFDTDPVSGAYGTLTVTAEGAWTYSVANGNSDVQGLNPTATLTETLSVTSADGVTTADVVITISGTDDVPALTASEGIAIEDTAPSISGSSGISGGDDGEDRFRTGTFSGSYGDLTVGGSGAWTYELNNDDEEIQDLAPADTLTETFTLTSNDGVTTTSVSIEIQGTDDVPTLTDDAATLTEDVDVDENGNLVAEGRLRSSGGDGGEGGFRGGTFAGAYGELTINAGSWTYTAANQQGPIQSLNAGDSLTDTLVVTSADGVTTTTVTITIQGTGNDAPRLIGAGVALTEDQDVDANGNLVATGTVGATGGADPTFIAETVTSAVGSLTVTAAGAWTYTADNSQPAIQGIGAGDTLTDILVVTNADGVATTSVTVTFRGVNDEPGATDDSGITANNVPLLTVADGATGNAGGQNADLLLNDIDLDGDDLTITAVNNAAANIGRVLAGSDGGEFTVNADGSWSFRPGDDFDGLTAGQPRTTSVSYTMTDGNGSSDSATLTVSVSVPNEPPTAADNRGAASRSAVLEVAADATGNADGNAGLLLNAADPDGDILAITAVAGRAANVGTATDGDNGGRFTINDDGSWRFDPGMDFDELEAGQTRITAVAYTVSDNNGAGATAALTVTVSGEGDVTPTVRHTELVYVTPQPATSVLGLIGGIDSAQDAAADAIRAAGYKAGRLDGPDPLLADIEKLALQIWDALDDRAVLPAGFIPVPDSARDAAPSGAGVGTVPLTRIPGVGVQPDGDAPDGDDFGDWVAPEPEVVLTEEQKRQQELESMTVDPKELVKEPSLSDCIELLLEDIRRLVGG